MRIDQRRVGVAAVLLSGIYTIVLFIPERAGIRFAFGVTLVVGMLLFVLFIPLPRWRESDERLRMATRFALIEAAAMAIGATIVYLVVR